MQANIGHPCKAKLGKSKHGTPAPTYKGPKKEFHSKNHIAINFWFYTNDINHCMKGSKKKVGVVLVKSFNYVASEDWNKPFTRRGFCIGKC